MRAESYSWLEGVRTINCFASQSKAPAVQSHDCQSSSEDATGVDLSQQSSGHPATRGRPVLRVLNQGKRKGGRFGLDGGKTLAHLAIRLQTQATAHPLAGTCTTLADWPSKQTNDCRSRQAHQLTTYNSCTFHNVVRCHDADCSHNADRRRIADHQRLKNAI